MPKGSIPWNKGLKGIYKWSEKSKQKHSKIAKEKGFGKWMKGRKLPEETKKKISEKLKGIKKTEKWKKHLSESHKGRHLSEETKEKMRKLMLLRWQNPEYRERQVKTHYGHKASITTKKKMSAARRGRKFSIEWRKKISEAHKGSKSSSWKGGVTPINKRIRRSMEFSLWRKAVFERDNYTCQRCGARGGNGKAVCLHPHHILNFAQYPKLRFIVDNGITLCKNCHIEFHKKYGSKNNTREQLEEFLKVCLH